MLTKKKSCSLWLKATTNLNPQFIFLHPVTDEKITYWDFEMGKSFGLQAVGKKWILLFQINNVCCFPAAINYDLDPL